MEAYVQLNNNKIHIGYFIDENDAALACNYSSAEMFKEFAVPNFIMNKSNSDNIECNEC